VSEGVAYRRPSPQVQYFETLCAQTVDEVTIVQGEFHQKRIVRAHRRHLSAVNTLA